MLQQPRPLVPFMFPKRSYSFETLQEYLSELSGLVAYYPLDDASGNMARVINPAVALGRNLALNGGFDADASWTKGPGCTISGGVAQTDGTNVGAQTAVQQTSPLIAGKSYEFTFDVVTLTPGGAYRPVLGGTLGTVRSAIGTYTETLVAGTAGTAVIRQQNTGTIGSIDNVSVRQVNIPASSAIADTELLADHDMEAATTAAWTIGNAATLSKQTGTSHGGTRVLRVARNTGNNPFARQDMLTVGKRFRLRGYARGDSSASVRAGDLVNPSSFTGTSSGTWQEYDALHLAQSVSYVQQSVTSTGAQYSEWDDCSVIEVPPMSGYNGNGVAANVPTVNQDAGSKLLKAYSFDGSNDFVNIYSADLNSAFNPDEGTLLVFAKVSDAGVWTDGAQRFIATIGLSSNEVYLRKSSTGSNRIDFVYTAGGTVKSIALTSFSPTDFFMLAITWSKSADEMKAYSNGVQTGATQTGLGAWAGNLNSAQCVIGAANTSAANRFSGFIAHPALVNRALSDAEIHRIAKLGGVAA